MKFIKNKQCVLCNPNLEIDKESIVCFHHWAEISEEKTHFLFKYNYLKKQRIPDELMCKLRKIEESLILIIENIERKKKEKTPNGKLYIGKRLRSKILERDNYKCKSCGWEPEGIESSSELHIDHIKPKFAGGTNDEKNLQVLCSTCNLHKAAHDFTKIKLNKSKVKHLKKESPQGGTSKDL